MRPLEESRRTIHGSFIQRVPERVHIAGCERTDNRMPPDSVLIRLRLCGTPRVEPWTSFFNRKNSNFLRQQRICAAQDGAGIHSTNCFDIGDLCVSVNTGIRPSGTGHCNLVVEELLKGVLQLALDGSQLRLDLPAMEAGTVICKCQLEVPHSIGYSMCLGVRAMPRITATVITFNEEDRIAEALASLSCCDEILVVDSGSTDRTREIAASRGARVMNNPWRGYSKQKNFAAEQSSNDWILSIDADERLSIELADEIVKWKNSGTHHSAVSMPRRAFYMGKWINHSGWYPDRKVRLYDRRLSRWEGDFVHERMRAGGPVHRFDGDLLHFPYRNWNEQMAKIDRYTRLAADAAFSAGIRGSYLKLVFGPPASFLKSFFVNAGFLDGWRGLAVAYQGGRYVFLRQFRILRSWNWRWL